MEMNLTSFLLMTLFNTAVCISLPRIVTLNWAEGVAKLLAQFNGKEVVDAKVVGENLPSA